MSTPTIRTPRYPWRRVLRTVFQMIVGAAVMAPLIYGAATNSDPELAAGWAGAALAISAGITRVMALPQVEAFLQRWVPFLSARPTDAPVVTSPDDVGEAVAAYFSGQAIARFDLYGPNDPRGAAFWDVATGIREGRVPLVDDERQ